MGGLKEVVKKIERKYGIILYSLLSVVVLLLYPAKNPLTYLMAIAGVILCYHFNRQDYLPYIFAGAFAAFGARALIGFFLNTDLPVFSILTGSMTHDSYTVINHYRWLENNLGYNRSYIDSWPFKEGLDIGDLVVIKGCENYEVGDIILYDVREAPIPIIHRIIKINEDGSYMTKGDHNPGLNLFEYSVRKEQIKGKVILKIPYLGMPYVLIYRIFGVI